MLRETDRQRERDRKRETCMYTCVPLLAAYRCRLETTSLYALDYTATERPDSKHPCILGCGCQLPGVVLFPLSLEPRPWPAVSSLSDFSLSCKFIPQEMLPFVVLGFGDHYCKPFTPSNPGSKSSNDPPTYLQKLGFLPAPGLCLLYYIYSHPCLKFLYFS